MTTREIGNYFYELGELLKLGELSPWQQIQVEKEYKRWQNVYANLRARQIKERGYLNESTEIDKYIINKINSEFE